MPLKLNVETLEGIDEAIQPLYKETENGFTLEVEDLPDTKGLKSALEKERKTVKEIRSQLKAFDGVDLEEYADLQTRKIALEEHDPEKIEQMLQDRVQKNNQTWETKFGDLQTELGRKEARLADLLISEELRRVGETLDVNGPSAMEDFVARGKALFTLVDDNVVPMANGEVVYGESGVEPLTMVEFGKKLAETAGHLFKPSGGGGSSNSGNGGAGSGTVRFKSDLSTAKEKATFIGKHGTEAFLALPEKRKEAAS